MRSTERYTVTGNADYIVQEEDTIRRNFAARKFYMHSERLRIIREWINGDPKVLSVGSGGYEPTVTGANYACDISQLSGELLQSLGWKGEFKVANCTLLPYPVHHFSKAYCTEVIEHLPSLDDVVRTFEELDRVAVDWLVTTPYFRRGCKNSDPDHKLDFDAYELAACITPKGYMIFEHGNHANKFWYIVKERGDPDAITFRSILNRHHQL